MTEQEAFEKIHAHVAEWEGFISDDDGDPGGLTKYGVSLQFLKDLGMPVGDLNFDGEINRKDVLCVTPEKAKELFKKNFWDDPGANRLPLKAAMIYYDSAVNTGCRQTTKLLQRACGVSDDGVIGPETIKAANTCDLDSMCEKFLQQREKFYNNLAASKSQFKKFLKGWLNRVAACRKLINSI